ncbi:MAG TPA: DUF58 domain-containing protein [Cellvibrio sp.]|nr:DUF58 domain-containing protein [Cellvibrio sp.]
MSVFTLASFRKLFLFWAAKRSPRAAQVILRHRGIYVLPGRQGLAFLLLAGLLWLLGTNYQNNLILGLAFFLVSILLLSIIHAFKNLLGLTFVPAATHTAAFAETAVFSILLSSQYRSQHCAIQLLLDDAEPVQVDLKPGQTVQVTLGIKAQQRGWLPLPRITVKSYFPFGLIRAWAYVDLEHRALVFPQAIASSAPPLALGQGGEGQGYSLQSGDEFQGFQTYQPGSPLSHIAWKQYARGAGMHLKDYRAAQAQEYRLDWQQLRVRDPELGWSYLCYWVNHFAQGNHHFALMLPDQTIEMGQGEIHRIRALTALALAGGNATAASDR